MKILVTGANGFVGNALIPKLLSAGHEVIGLVRSEDKIPGTIKGVRWVEGDLLKPESLPELESVHRTYYLVHGLKEESDDFEHLETRAAINFLNWIRPYNPGVIYLGGLGEEGNVSPHLRSRHLTGAVLGASGLDVIEFRASIILGEGSLSFEIIKALTERLPFRPEISLLSQKCQPLALSDLLKYLVLALDHPSQGHKVYEVGGPDVVLYGELLDLYAEIKGLRRKKIKLPEVEPRVLLKAFDYALPEHSDAGKKLTQSLAYPTVVTDESAHEAFPKVKPKSLQVAMEMAQAASTTHYPPLWEKDFLKTLLSDKILTQSGLLSPELLRSLEKVGKLKDILTRR